MRWVYLLVSAVVLAPVKDASGQEPGERVRLTVQSPVSRQLIGTFVGQQADSLWVELPGQPTPKAIARAATTRLEVSRGQQRATLRGAEIGAGLGAISGLVASGVSASESRPCGAAERVGVCLSDWYGHAFRGGLIGAAVGGAIGAALGWAVKTERWAGTPLSHLRMIAATPRGVDLALSLAF